MQPLAQTTKTSGLRSGVARSPLCGTTPQQPALQRRKLLAILPVLALAPQPALAVPPLDRNHAVDDAASPFVQDLLRKTEAKREERKKERLDDYYRRNFSDYFQFEAGSSRSGVSPETRAAIDQWLETNVEEPKRRQAAQP